jgi:hypothetical protein
MTPYASPFSVLAGQAAAPVHDPHFGVAIEGARSAEAEHLLPWTRRASRKARTPFDLVWVLLSEEALAGLYSLADGLSVGIDDYTRLRPTPRGKKHFNPGGRHLSIAENCSDERRQLFCRREQPTCKAV